MYSDLLASARTFLTAVVCWSLACAVLPAAAAPPRPLCIPAVQQFNPKNGTFTLQNGSRIVIKKTQYGLCISIARLLSRELHLHDGVDLPISSGEARPGDIRLLIGTPGKHAHLTEYKLAVGSMITAKSNTTDGLFYATRTLLQYLHGTTSVPKGVTTDWPTYPYRGLMVDVGRKYFTVEWLKHEMRLMAAVKLNVLHLHFTDDEGFRLQSNSHPELNIGTSPVYTHKDIRELVAYASTYHIDIVPEIDFPAHCGAILKAHPELRLVAASGRSLPNDMDISKPAAISLVKDLLHEYLPLFPGPYWHCGGDEYLHRAQYSQYPQLAAWAKAHVAHNAAPWDTFIAFINMEDEIVRRAGKTMRAWADTYEFQAGGNDPLKLNRDICQELWNGYDNAGLMMKEGFRISNASYPVLYYNVGVGASLPEQQAATMLTTWAPNAFYQHGGSWVSVPRSANLQGACYHIWADNAHAETETTIANNIRLPLCALAEKCWNPGAAKLSLSGLQCLMAGMIQTCVAP